MNVRFALLFAVSLVLTAAAPALAQIDAPEPLVVMNLAAHPDDEDGLTLAYYRHVQDAAAYSVIYTRGEGGQNEIGPDLYEKLGAIRTDETERAARLLGTQVRFLNFYDFGYSKFASESFEAWGGRDSVTARLVYLVRKLKPDVIFTNHDTLTVGNTQHGHHQVVGLSAYDAFALAADPSFHPEHLAEPGVDLWQPKRLFLRKWRWRGGEGSQAADVKVPVGDLVPGRDVSAADIAIKAVAEHRSQGFDKFAPRFRRDTTYFQLLRAAPGVPPLPDDATSLAAGLAPNEHAADADLAYLIDSGRITAGLPGDATLQPDVAIALPGADVPVRWTRDLAFHSSAGQPHPVEIVFSGAVDTTVTVAPGAAPAAVLRIPADATPTLPKHARQYDRTLSTPPVQYAVRRPGDADALYAAGHLALEIAPPLAIEPAAQVIRLRPGTNRIPVRALVYDGAVDSVVVGINMNERGPSETRITLEDQTFAVPADGVLDAAVELTLDEAEVTPGPYPLTISAVPLTIEGDVAERGVPVSTTQLARALPPVSVPEGLRVGFVKSYDDATANALRDLGATVVPLDAAALRAGDFDDLHTIVVDIRAYLVRDDLRRHNDRLLDWVRDGGHLVVNYQKTFEWNPGYDDPFVEGEQNPAGFAPYPLLLGRDRVTVEDAPVTLLTPDHALFREPHEIAAADWDDWVQERGLYFPADYDDRYVELFAMSDPGEAPLRSSTLFAEVGDGTYVYTALGWYRQLAAFNPGAYRLFANLVSLPLADERAARGGSDARADG
jgi:LmbE family N-acetylglucosaminyl deacetylase